MYNFDPKWLEKLAAMRASGQAPYPSAAGLVPTHTSAELHKRCDGVEDPKAVVPDDVAVAGRVMFRNVMGKAMFLRIADRAGVIQLYARREEVGDAAFAVLKGVDIGDFVWCKGSLMRTKTAELSVQVKDGRLAAKNLSPFPDRFHTLSDVELRSRQRYVDLFMNPESQATFRMRSAIVRYVRDFFHARDFIEVETPMMQTIPGGATARPFITHHNALDIELYLRVAPELFLKRLIVGGMERVFEVNRNFRNEGLSHKHNPEFTMLEFYWAWATYLELMDLTETLLSGVCAHVTGGHRIKFAEMEIDFSPPFRRADMDLLISEATGLSRADLRDPVRIRQFWTDAHGAGEDLPSTFGRWWEKLFEHYVEPNLVNPTFVTGFPAEISPLARRSDDDPDRTDRFELYVARWELANAFTELNDPVDQAERFAAQVSARDAGDAEAMHFDADYIRALAYGMPPTAGEGIGIDRLVMLLTGRTSIREVILFPTHRPEAHG
jgi:lysyl-tRNA synthetase, class II